MDRVVLDTGVLIAGLDHGLSELTDTTDIAIPAIVIAEFRLGCLLDPNQQRAEGNRAYLNTLLGVAPTLDYTRAVAEAHAALMRHTRQTGQPRGAHDLIIAATANATGRAICTTDRRVRFEELPNVECTLVRPQ